MMKRPQQHLAIGFATAVLLAITYWLVPGDDKKYLWSMATGYTSIILLATTLVIGPLNLIRKRHNPISTNLRRDIGIWCGLVGLTHVVIGIQVHMGNIFLYFFKAVDGDNAFVLRDDLFGAANYTGFIAAAISLMLLIISNDVSMRMLRPKKWKNLQRWSYLFFVFTFAHAVMYQVIEKRAMPLVILMSIIMVTAIVFQIKGIRTHRLNR